MAKISSEMIKEIRATTGAGLLDCKKALNDSDGDMEKAIKGLREKGLAKAAKRSHRDTAEGRIISYIHGLRIGVLLELNCETDFVAKTDKFEELGNDICMQIAATNPICVNVEDVPSETVEKEKEIFRIQLEKEGKPANIIDNILVGKVKKFHKEVVLLEQIYIRDSKLTVSDLLKDAISTFGENITIGKFSRFEIGA